MHQTRALNLLRSAVVSHQAEALCEGSLEDRLQKARELLINGVTASRMTPMWQLLDYCREHGLHETDDELFIAVETLDPQR